MVCPGDFVPADKLEKLGQESTGMAKRKYTAEEIVALLRQVEVSMANGKTTPQAYRESGITEQTYYRWRKEYGGLTSRPNGSKCWRRRTRGLSGWWRCDPAERPAAALHTRRRCGLSFGSAELGS